jgi:putative glutamine amidotransferase
MIHLGISSSFLYPDPKRTWFPPKMLSYLENDLASCLSEFDVIPVLIPDLPDKQLLSLMEKMDGFVFSAGSDLCPETYNEDYLDQSKWPGDLYRDQYEYKILDHCMAHKVPILGICRGIQIINAYFGGSLYQDLVSEGQVQHRDGKQYDQRHHGIRLIEGGYLDSLFGPLKNPCVNSVHHQSIHRLAQGFNIEAVSEDGLVEAISFHDMKEHFILATQWHPEFSKTLEGIVIAGKPILDAFLNRVREEKNK